MDGKLIIMNNNKIARSTNFLLLLAFQLCLTAQVMRELCEVLETEATLQPVVRSIKTALGESGKDVLARDVSQGT